MDNNALYNNDPIIALATPLARSALAIIRLSGVGTLSLLKPSFTGKLKESNKLVFGKIININTSKVLDEVTIVSFHNKAGYTGEESAEIFCHGNPYIIQTLLDYFLDIGFRLALPGEFSFRAVRNNKIDLTQAEAVHELIMANTALSAESALNRLSGRLGREFLVIYNYFIDRLGKIEAYLDYPGEELEPFVWEPLDGIRNQLNNYLKYEPVAHILKDGALVVLAGEPNVGKSSIFNWLLQEERAIVSQEAGTTRDYIEMTLDIKGYPLRLVDTAGLRESNEEVEKIGIQHSFNLLNKADLIVYVTTSNQLADINFIDKYSHKLLWVENKCDDGQNGYSLLNLTPIAISAQKQIGHNKLLNAILEKLDPEAIAHNKEITLLGSTRQREILKEVLLEIKNIEGVAQKENLDLIAFSLRRVCNHFSQLLGGDVQDEAMSSMFKQFCLGK